MIQPPITAPSGAVEAAERGGGERVDHHRAHQVQVQEQPRRDEHPGQRPARRGDAPADHQHPPDRDADEPAGSRGSWHRAHGQPDAACAGRSGTAAPTTPSSTATMPERLDATAHAPTSTCRRGNRLGKPRLLKPQIQPRGALTRMNRPSVTITSVSVSPPSTGRMTTRSISMPPITNASASVARKRQADRQPRLDQAPGHERGEHGHLALGEVHDPGRAEDQHQGQRQRPVDRAGGDPVDIVSTKRCHGSDPQVGRAHVVVLGQLGRRARQHDAARLQHVGVRRRTRARGSRSAPPPASWCPRPP